MKYYPITTCCLLALLFFFSCKKDQQGDPVRITPNLPTVDDYVSLRPYNYWIYELYDIDSLGQATATGQYDSAYVLRDTIVNGKYYHVLMMTEVWGAPKSPLLLRDSLNYVVDIDGQVHFALHDYQTVFSSSYRLQASQAPNDSIGLRETQMAEKNRTTTVPAGSFITNAFRTTWYMHPYWAASMGAERRLYDRYSIHKGIVSRTLLPFLGSKSGMELRLVRCFVIYPVTLNK